MEIRMSLDALKTIEIFAKNNTKSLNDFLYLQGQMQNEFYKFTSLQLGVDTRLEKALECGRVCVSGRKTIKDGNKNEEDDDE